MKNVKRNKSLEVKNQLSKFAPKKSIDEERHPEEQNIPPEDYPKKKPMANKEIRQQG